MGKNEKTADRFSLKAFHLLILLLFASLFALQVVPCLTMDSPCGDEPMDLADGFYYWKGDVISGNEHPPFAKALQALPLLGMHLKTTIPKEIHAFQPRDAYFCERLNQDRFEDMVTMGRYVSLLFGLALGWLLWRISRGFSTVFCFLTMALWAFEPNLLAFSGLILADLPFTCCFLAAVYSFQRLLEKPGWRKSVLCGFLTGCAVTCKFSGALLLVIYIALEFQRFLEKKKLGMNGPKEPSLTSRWLTGLAAFAFWIFLIYLPGTVKIPGHQWPFHYFWCGFSTIASLSSCPVFFKGVLSYQTHWDYYPIALALKSTLPFLILLALSIGLGVFKKIKIPIWQWMPPLLLIIVMLPFRQIGIREILPVYPFFILMAAGAGEWLWWKGGSQPPLGRVAVFALLIFHAGSVVLSFPNHISYFNEIIPPQRKIYWLGDSNLDIGQDTKRLAQTARERNWTHVKLAYFGGPDPDLYGMKWEPWRVKDLDGPQPGWVYAISAEYIQLGPAFLPEAGKIGQSWVSSLPPSGRVGDTWYYFEVPGQIQPDNSRPLLSILRFNEGGPTSP